MKIKLIIFTACLASLVCLGETIYIPSDYPTIQEGLYAASSGDSISSVSDAGTGNGIYLEDVIGWETADFDVRNFFLAVIIENCRDLNLHHNHFCENTFPYARAMVIENCSDIIIHHNVISNNQYDGADMYQLKESISFINNTIVHTNYNGIMIWHATEGLAVINNIIAFNGHGGVKFYPGIPQGDAVLIYNNSFNNNPNWANCVPGIGNISDDPSFTGHWLSPYSLHSYSPCIDAGDPSSPLDPDGTRADMGAFYFDQRPDGIGLLCLTIADDNILLDCEDIPGALFYYIYSSYQPDFIISGEHLLDSTTFSDYTDTGILPQGKITIKLRRIPGIEQISVLSRQVLQVL